MNLDKLQDMTQEDKELRFKDICARLPYGVIVSPIDCGKAKLIGFKNDHPILFNLVLQKEYDKSWEIEYVKPYLRHLSSMTEEEARDIVILHGNNPEDILSIKVTDDYIDIILDDGVCSTIPSIIWYDEIISSVECFDYLNKNMFDYRGLIEKGLAISTEVLNPYKD